MKTVQGFLSLLLVAAFFIGAGSVAMAERSVGKTAESWATDPKTGCQICWVSDYYTIVAATWTGPVVNGKAEGKGNLTVTTRGKDGKESQWQGEVEMKAGKLDGKGSIKLSDGDSYDGDYKAGVREGKGLYKFPNGNTYDGDWKNNKMEGMGIYKKPDGDYSEGEWKNNVMDGKGKVRWADGKAYDGDVKNGHMEGKGILKYPNGSVYEGGIHHDDPAGYGVLKDPSGKVLYQGERNNTANDSAEQF
jgi:hypothetical protein